MSTKAQPIHTEEIPPDPERVIEGLRDTGYEFTTAVADIVDNSIAAGASSVDIRLQMDFGGDVLLMVGDNGSGMDRPGLLDAMRYGSKKRPSAASLGKFGLGLKTASTAFCRRLSVVTRASAKAEVLKATWDLDHVAELGKWQVLLPPVPQHEAKLLNEIAGGSSGTLVVWEKVDRLLRDYAAPGGKAAKSALKRHEDDLRAHLGMVYQRFLDADDDREKTIELKLNGVPIEAWNPFCAREVEKPVAEKTLPIELPDGSKATFTVRAFVIPRKEEFSSQEAAKEARLSNDLQGIYVYRENRLIHGPDWMGMFRKEPHMTLSRVELSFDHQLDDAFQVDIKKSRILLANELYDWLRDKFLPAPRREAQERYRNGEQATITGTAALLHKASNNTIHASAEDLKSATVTSVDGNTGDVTVENKNGTTRLKIKILELDEPGELHVKAVDGLNDGLLWEPTFINGNQAVRINSTHPYYRKVYIPNRQSGVTIQGLDSLMWALCVAELGNVNESSRRNFEEMRFEVSRVLRRLVEDLPDPDLNVETE